jgi:hypothetical protein
MGADSISYDSSVPIRRMFVFSAVYCLVLAAGIFGLAYWTNNLVVGVVAGVMAAALVCYAYYRTLVHTCRECNFDTENIRWRGFLSAGVAKLCSISSVRQAGRVSLTIRGKELVGCGSTCLVVVRFEQGSELYLVGRRWGKQRRALGSFADTLDVAVTASKSAVMSDVRLPEDGSKGG